MDLAKIYPPRPDWVHKGNYGTDLVIAGSKLYSGSATLAAVSAARSGADLVVVAAPERAANIAATTLVDLITYPLSGANLATRHIRDILDIAQLRRANSVVLGCGLGRHQGTQGAIQKLIQKFIVPIVIDADGLAAIALKPEVISGKQVVLTPHAGELATLLGIEKIGADFDVRLAHAKEAASKYRAVVLLKGHVDIITGGVSAISNSSGSPLMTKGGFGDTLAGILGALLARGVGILEAAHVAAYINGRAGEMAVATHGEGVVASDIFEYIPKAIQSG